MSTYVNEAQLFDIDTRPCPEVDVRDLLIYAKDSTEENVVDLSTISDKGPFHGFGVVSFGGKTAVECILKKFWSIALNTAKMKNRSFGFKLHMLITV